MFDNIGKKLKMLAQIICWVGIFASAITGIVFMARVSFWIGLLILVAGAVASWISSLGIYGFGELVENSDIRTNIAAKQELEREKEKKNA